MCFRLIFFIFLLFPDCLCFIVSNFSFIFFRGGRRVFCFCFSPSAHLQSVLIALRWMQVRLAGRTSLFRSMCFLLFFLLMGFFGFNSPGIRLNHCHIFLVLFGWLSSSIFCLNLVFLVSLGTGRKVPLLSQHGSRKEKKARKMNKSKMFETAFCFQALSKYILTLFILLDCNIHE